MEAVSSAALSIPLAFVTTRLVIFSMNDRNVRAAHRHAYTHASSLNAWNISAFAEIKWNVSLQLSQLGILGPIRQ